MKIMNLPYQVYFVLFLIIGYHTKSQTIDSVYSSDGKLEGYGEVKNGHRSGTWHFNFSKNKSYKTITYGPENIAVVKYYKDGDNTEVIDLSTDSATYKTIPNNLFYLEGLIAATYDSQYKITENGECIFYYSNGVISDSGINKNGYHEGTWVEHYYSSLVGSIINFKEGKMNGKHIAYYDKGNAVMIESQYKNDALYGSYKEYYISGNIKKEGYYSEDLKPLNVTEKNRDSLSSQFPNISIPKDFFPLFPISLKNGTWKYYSENGELIKKEIWREGKLIDTQKQ
jgi:antitoxin component YwqK of YwqJK toxin-antitoxin module